MTWSILEGNCLDVLPTLPAGSIQMVVTSPPYWGLRDYGVPGQLGLEPTPEEYVANLVEVFRQVRRVLRDDGTVWLNLGDSYSGREFTGRHDSGEQRPGFHGQANGYGGERTRIKRQDGLKPKDLVGIPWRVAFALQADSWYLRSDIVWAKPNPMPESVTDRPTKAHEYVFLLSKSARYFYDQEAVREPSLKFEAEGPRPRTKFDGEEFVEASMRGTHNQAQVTAARNLRSVWNIPTEPFPEAHFATFPK